jgi:integrase
VFAAYIEHLATRSPPAKAATFRVIETCRRRLSDWDNKPVSDIDAEEILTRFKDGIKKVKSPKTREVVEKGRSITEQTFRWASLAVNYALRRELFDARTHNRAPRHQVNPFDILVLEKKYRGKAQLERDYKQRGARNPLALRDGTLQRFLRAVWLRRQSGDSRLGADYLLITLLIGARQQETAARQWRDRLTAAEAERSSWVDLHERFGFFFNTKNGSDYTFPIADALYELLHQRKEDRTRGETFVFPVRNRRAKHVRHYHDPKTIIRNVARDAKLKVLRTHDLRRTFGRIAEEQTSMRMVKILLNHRRPGETTERYTEAEWHRFRDVLQSMETTILSAEPLVYNALLPAARYPRMEGDGHEASKHRHRGVAHSD